LLKNRTEIVTFKYVKPRMSENVTNTTLTLNKKRKDVGISIIYYVSLILTFLRNTSFFHKFAKTLFALYLNY